VPLDALLLAIPYDSEARAAFICPQCNDLVDQRIVGGDVAILVGGGCMPIAVEAWREA
jgi:hypothetical protein